MRIKRRQFMYEKLISLPGLLVMLSIFNLFCKL